MKIFTIHQILIVLMLTVSFAYPYSVESSSEDESDKILPTPDIIQQLFTNQFIDTLPPNLRNGVTEAANRFQMTRDQFLLKCLKELQAFQDYSNINFITAIQKTYTFIEENLSDEQLDLLENLQQPGLSLISLLMTDSLPIEQLKKFYDLEIKLLKEPMDSQSFFQELTELIAENIVEE